MLETLSNSLLSVSQNIEIVLVIEEKMFSLDSWNSSSSSQNHAEDESKCHESQEAFTRRKTDGRAWKSNVSMCCWHRVESKNGKTAAA